MWLKGFKVIYFNEKSWKSYMSLFFNCIDNHIYWKFYNYDFLIVGTTNIVVNENQLHVSDC